MARSVGRILSSLYTINLMINTYDTYIHTNTKVEDGKVVYEYQRFSFIYSFIECPPLSYNKFHITNKIVQV